MNDPIEKGMAFFMGCCGILVLTWSYYILFK